MCFHITTQSYSTIRMFVLGLSTHTLLHMWRELTVAVTIQFFIHNFHTIKANSHHNYGQSSGPNKLYWPPCGCSIVKLHTLCMYLPYRISSLLMPVGCLSIELNRTSSLGVSIKQRTPSLHTKAYINTTGKCGLA